MRSFMTWEKRLKSFSRQSLSVLSFYSGWYQLSGYLKINHGARILCFHGINEIPTSQYAVSASNFREQMRFLKENYEIVSMDQLVTLLQNSQPIPSRVVAVTVDDGFQDFYVYGFPILRQYAIPATVFLPTGFIDGDIEDEKKQKLPQSEFLSWDQIREMHKFGIDFGSHTISHNSLPSLTQPEIQHELEYSKSRLESELDEPVKGFAYPYGTFRNIDTGIEKIIANSGYSWALTSVSGLNSKGLNPFSLRRTVIERDDGIAGFKRALKGALDGWVVIQKFGYYMRRP
jgi:peptidoglycan/xylan/chitin deacetylase (PgdA/CDA1 family)